MKTLFNNRCETVLITMRSGNHESITSKQIAQWLEMSETTVGPFILKMLQFNILKKVGAARNTHYELTEACHNSLESQLKTKDLLQSVKYVVDGLPNILLLKLKQ